MAQTKTKRKSAGNRSARGTSSAPNESASAAVLTLAEAAAYLRLSEQEILQLVHYQGLPGRSAGNDWRFLKAAIQDWLCTPPKPSSKEAVLPRIGSWQDDPHVEEELKEIYRRRGRPMTEEPS